MARTVQVTFDATDAHALASWWADLLGYEIEDVHDRVQSLLDQGIVAEADVVRVDGRLFFAGVATARDPEGAGPRLYVQTVPEPKTAKNRVHLDVTVRQEELDAAVERVIANGATLVEFREHPGQRWAVMQDPDGNEFCLH
jgi:uncharacterized glyoxalase superfamily protein PhnB